MTWDPDQYERFSDHRLRPGLDLLARVPPLAPTRVIDLGCGTGVLTRYLVRRWPDAQVTGMDASLEMLERAPTADTHVTWAAGDISTWEPEEHYDLIFSNAALHWIDDHPSLMARLGRSLSPGGVLAVQMPDNWSEPTHRIPAAVLDENDVYAEARSALLRDRVAAPTKYRRWLGSDFVVDVWSTTYHHVLTGPDPILDWVSGSVLRPVLDALDDPQRQAFVAECAQRYRAAYPPDATGTTVLPFRRLFIVARRE